MTYRWKALDEGYNFILDFIPIGGLYTELCAPKVARVPTLGISEQNAIWMAKHKVYYKGEGVVFPQV